MELKFYNEITKMEEKYEFVRELYKVTNGMFYLYKKGNEEVVVKKLDKITDSEGQIEIDKDLYSYKRLNSLDINIPKLLGYSREENLVVKEYLKGRDVLGFIKEGTLDENIYFELLKYSELLNSDNLNIDYFPNNFILKDGKLFYINYKVFPYTEEFNLRNWGIFYWLNSRGIARYMETNDEKYINKNEKRFPIINEELEELRENIYFKYLNWKYE